MENVRQELLNKNLFAILTDIQICEKLLVGTQNHGSRPRTIGTQMGQKREETMSAKMKHSIAEIKKKTICANAPQEPQSFTSINTTMVSHLQKAKLLL